MKDVKLPIKSLYLHFPFCRHLCNYCDFYKNIKGGESDISTFQSLLSDMVDNHNKFLIENGYEWQSLETLYIGGGTPSLWGAGGAVFLKNLLSANNIELSSSGEFTLEVNPGGWTDETLVRWKEFGVNRFSLGIQSLDSRFIKVLDRVHNIDDVYETLEKFNELEANFSVDFMLGLPYSDEYNRDVIKELEEILKFNPSHISLYILTVKSHYIHKEKLPDDEWIEKEYLKVASFLKSKGFDHYEVSNFAKPGFESKHNIRYWDSESVAALGPSATGLFSEKGIRYKWKTTGAEFILENLNEKELFLEKVYMKLRINKGISLDFFGEGKLESLGNDWVEKGYATIENNKVILNSRGFLILDSLMDDLFKTFPESF